MENCGICGQEHEDAAPALEPVDMDEARAQAKDELDEKLSSLDAIIMLGDMAMPDNARTILIDRLTVMQEILQAEAEALGKRIVTLRGAQWN